MTDSDCVLCAGKDMDEALLVTEVWSDDLWRLTTVRVGEVAGYSYLSPRRHIPHITDLDGPEASSFGHVVARSASAIKESTGADLVYTYVFGAGLDHFHVHLAPHTGSRSPLVDHPIKGPRSKVLLPTGEEIWTSDIYRLQSRELMNAAIDGIREHLAG
ncbi:MAG: HIT family protein [Acidimicrobiia bacterium]